MTISSFTSPLVNSLLPRLDRGLGGGNGAGQSAFDNDKSVASDTTQLSGQGKDQLAQFQRRNSVSPLYTVIPVNERPTSQQSADTILSFIGGRLQALADSGASTEELKDLYDQGVKGFMQGLKEAKNILQGLGALTGEVSDSVDMTEKLVLEGLNEMRQQFLGASTPATVPTTAPTTAEPKEQVPVLKAIAAYQEQSSVVSQSRVVSGDRGQGAGFRSLAASYAQSYQRNESVELQVLTRDGDVINLSFSANTASSQSFSFSDSSGSKGISASLAYASNSSASDRFSLSVNGELDEGEMTALNELLEEVSALSEEFFEGDFDQALAMAMDFEMDDSEFSAMSLDLARSTRSSVVEAYTGVAGPEAESGPKTATNVDVQTSGFVGETVDYLQDLLEKAVSFTDPKSLITSLLASVLARHIF